MKLQAIAKQRVQAEFAIGIYIAKMLWLIPLWITEVTLIDTA